MRKVVPAVVIAGLVAAGGIGYGGYAAAADDVQLSIDGQSTRITTHAGTVADLLHDQGVTISERDDIQPLPSSPIDGDTTITVNYARQLKITVDGREDSYWTTARHVDEALQEMSIPATAKLSTPRESAISRDGIHIRVDTSKTATVIAGGKSRQVTTTGQTVADALKQAKVAYDGDDQVTPKPTSLLADQAKITVKKVEVKKKTRSVTEDFKTIERDSSSLFEGDTDTERKGIDGVTEQIWEHTYVDGRESKKRMLSSKITTERQDKLVLVGTKERPNDDSDSGDSDSGDSDASESDAGDSGSSGSDDQPRNDEDSGQSGQCKASYYWQGQQTANGERFNTNELTAAHKTLAFNSRVKVTNLANGKSVVVRINDRGPYISGRCLDLSRAAMKQVGGTAAGVISVKYQVL